MTVRMQTQRGDSVMRCAGNSRRWICLATCALVTFGGFVIAAAQDESIEKKTKIHRLSTTQRAVYDAFTYVNRIPEKTQEGESPKQLAGRIFGRLGNQEGRVLLKLPPGMDKESYLAFKTFFRYEGDAQVGNCAACHVPTEFADTLEHVVAKGGSPTAAPSLRNLKKRNVDIAKVVKEKIAASKQKQSGEAEEIDDAYAVMKLTEEDIPGLVTFIDLLNDGPESDFRDLILDAELLDTSDFFN